MSRTFAYISVAIAVAVIISVILRIYEVTDFTLYSSYVTNIILIQTVVSLVLYIKEKTKTSRNTFIISVVNFIVLELFIFGIIIIPIMQGSFASV